MNAEERLLRCRLMEEMADRPEYSAKLGLHGETTRCGQLTDTKEEPCHDQKDTRGTAVPE